jgi:hypothetical protein
MSEEQGIEQTGVKVVDSAKQMDENIKNKKLIVGKPKKDKSGTLVYTIKNKTKSSGKLALVKLGHVFNYLPAGIIDKSETGIGGTSLELDCDRDSIVVEPYVNTALSKAGQQTLDNKYRVLFYGSQSKYIKINSATKCGKISTKSFNPKATISEYFDWARNNNQPIKITCVSDQLPSLKEEINTIQKDLFNTFHLVLDEIDSMQEQSAFRGAMEPCLRVFKDHPSARKTLISATIKHFHDPDISNLEKIKIQYHRVEKKNLICVFTEDVTEEVIHQLNQDQYYNGKVVIACNNISYCLSIADTLKKIVTFKNKKIAILCSSTRKSDAGNYYATIKDSYLPADINLITAAYFNGIDINEDYHSIILGDGSAASMRISTDLIFQISGRCRTKTLSNSFLVSTGRDYHYKNYTLEELVANSGERKIVEDFIKAMRKSTNNYSKDVALAVQNLFAEGTREMPPVWYIDNGEVCVSYLNIDNRLEQQITHQAYSNEKTILKSLRKRFAVEIQPSLYNKKVNKQIEQLDLEEIARSVVARLKTLNRSNDYTTQIKDIKKSLHRKTLPIEKTIIDIFNLYLGNESAELLKLHNAVDLCLAEKKYAQAFEKLLVAIKYNFLVLPNSSDLDSLLTTYFPQGDYTIPDMNSKAANFCRVLKKGTSLSSTSIKDLVKKLTGNKKLVRSSLLSIKEHKTKKARMVRVTGYDPFNVIP